MPDTSPPLTLSTMTPIAVGKLCSIAPKGFVCERRPHAEEFKRERNAAPVIVGVGKLDGDMLFARIVKIPAHVNPVAAGRHDHVFHRESPSTHSVGADRPSRKEA